MCCRTASRRRCAAPFSRDPSLLAAAAANDSDSVYSRGKRCNGSTAATRPGASSVFRDVEGPRRPKDGAPVLRGGGGDSGEVMIEVAGLARDHAEGKPKGGAAACKYPPPLQLATALSKSSVVYVETCRAPPAPMWCAPLRNAVSGSGHRAAVDIIKRTSCFSVCPAARAGEGVVPVSRRRPMRPIGAEMKRSRRPDGMMRRGRPWRGSC